MKADSVLATIGGTPHIRLSRLFPDHEVWVKSERANPGGSIKDRIGLAMIEDAEQAGKLKPGGTIIEPAIPALDLPWPPRSKATSWSLLCRKA